MILPDDPSISSQVGDSVSGVDTISQPNRPQVRPVAVKGYCSGKGLEDLHRIHGIEATYMEASWLLEDTKLKE